MSDNKKPESQENTESGEDIQKKSTNYGPPDDSPVKPTTLTSSGPILPGIGDNIMSGWSLVRIIAIMCFLASLALGAMLAVNDAAKKWSNNLSGALTVQLKSHPEMSESDQIAKTIALLKDTEAVSSINVLNKAASAKLLEPWLGNQTILNELPLPVLIEVSLEGNRDDLGNFEALRKGLKDGVPGAVLDDHRRWNDQLDRVSNALRLLTFGILLMIIMATAMIIIFATRSGLAANEDIVEVLHLIGAKDGLIAKEFQNHFFWIALWAGLMGIGGAGLTFMALGQASRAGWAAEAIAFLPTLAFQPSFYVFLLLIPTGAIALTTITARLTVIQTLTKVV
jgi:cell division transport system permease protein